MTGFQQSGQYSSRSLTTFDNFGSTLAAINQAFSTGSKYVHGTKRNVADSKWVDVKQHGVRFMSGSRLKTERRRLVKGSLRKVFRQPCKRNTYLEHILSSLSYLFIENN